MLLICDREQLGALADELRATILTALRDRARSTTELARQFGIPKGTVAHHLKVLERAGLIRVVRTRKVRAVTEKFYGRAARRFVVHNSDDDPTVMIATTTLCQALTEVAPSDDAAPAAVRLIHAKLTPAGVTEFLRGLEHLIDSLSSLDEPDGQLYGFAAALYTTTSPTRHANDPRRPRSEK